MWISHPFSLLLQRGQRNRAAAVLWWDDRHGGGTWGVERGCFFGGVKDVQIYGGGGNTKSFLTYVWVKI